MPLRSIYNTNTHTQVYDTLNALRWYSYMIHLDAQLKSILIGWNGVNTQRHHINNDSQQKKKLHENSVLFRCFIGCWISLLFALITINGVKMEWCTYKNAGAKILCQSNGQNNIRAKDSWMEIHNYRISRKCFYVCAVLMWPVPPKVMHIDFFASDPTR